MAELSLAPIRRVVKNEGAKRVSEDAVDELRAKVEQYAKEKAREANKLAKHDGRVTVKKKDVRALD